LALDPQLADAHFNLARLYEKATDPWRRFGICSPIGD
jgi:hypothetical protein